MLNHRINKFFRTGDNYLQFKKVVWMVETKTQVIEVKNPPKLMIGYLEQHDMAQTVMGVVSFRKLGLKYYEAFKRLPSK